MNRSSTQNRPIRVDSIPCGQIRIRRVGDHLEEHQPVESAPDSWAGTGSPSTGKVAITMVNVHPGVLVVVGLLEVLARVHLDQGHAGRVLGDGDAVPDRVVAHQLVHDRRSEDDTRADGSELLVWGVHVVGLGSGERGLTTVFVVGDGPVPHQVERPHRATRILPLEPGGEILVVQFPVAWHDRTLV